MLQKLWESVFGNGSDGTLAEAAGDRRLVDLVLSGARGDRSKAAVSEFSRRHASRG